MSSENLEIAKREYQAGRDAFERGLYREAIEYLEKASALLSRNSRLGGEVTILLVTAYEGAGRSSDAIALCEQIQRHPDSETSKQARQLLYILKAPQLKRPSEWLTQIPDLGTAAENESKIRIGSANGNNSSRPKPQEPEPVDLSQVNTRDNRFIWLALLVIGLTLGSLLWLSF